MSHSRPPVHTLPAFALLALVVAGPALAGGPVLSVGGFSSQVSPGTATIGAGIGTGASANGASPLRARQASSPPTSQPAAPEPPPPTLASDSPLLANAAPAGPGSLWYQGSPGQECIYAPGASPACFQIVAPPAPAIDVPATAASLASRLVLSLPPIASSPTAARDGLTGAPSWFWLPSPPAAQQLSVSLDGETVTVSAQPGPVAWSFGDGAGLVGGAGLPFQPGAAPPGAVTHVFQTRCLPGDRGADPYVLPDCGPGGYPVSARVSWTISYTASGPLRASATLPARTTSAELVYPVSEVRAFLGGGAA